MNRSLAVNSGTLAKSGLIKMTKANVPVVSANVTNTNKRSQCSL